VIGSKRLGELELNGVNSRQHQTAYQKHQRERCPGPSSERGSKCYLTHKLASRSDCEICVALVTFVKLSFLGHDLTPFITTHQWYSSEARIFSACTVETEGPFGLYQQPYGHAAC
jgi:hypothetical protein